MANGDITKQIEYDKIEIVNKWNIQVRQAIIIMEEQADGSKKELSRSFHRHVLDPFISTYKTKNSEDGKLALPDRDADGKLQWTHTPTDLSSENAKVKAIAESAWDNDTKAAYKTFTESQSI
tara:strand:- start:190 stop:555 length:366 start_codon:yes stop_codon:yes gene_type:complete